MKLLPKHVNELESLRAARWFRESTKEQYDAFGPDSQREHQDRAISQYLMADTGIEWMVAASGWKDVWTTSAFSDMLERAGTDFDVLVVPYYSRFMRNIKQALVFRDEIHGTARAAAGSGSRRSPADFMTLGAETGGPGAGHTNARSEGGRRRVSSLAPLAWAVPRPR